MRKQTQLVPGEIRLETMQKVVRNRLLREVESLAVCERCVDMVLRYMV